MALAGFLPACFLVDTKTHVEEGQLYTTGNASYDSFFAGVHSLHEDAMHAKEDEGKARAVLAHALHTSDGADADLHAAKERAQKLRDKNVFLHLQLTPEAKLLGAHGALGAEVDAMVKGVEESARMSIALSQQLGTFDDRVTDLQKKREALRANATQDLHQMSPVRREEITRELDASKDVIATDAETIALYAGAASKFVLDLARAVETGGKPPATLADSKPGNLKPNATSPRHGGAPNAGKPASGASPAPPPKKSGGDDFEP